MNQPSKVFARVDPVFRDRVKAEANRRFEGNESLVVRDALRLYLRLRDQLGASFEAEVEKLAPVATSENERGAA